MDPSHTQQFDGCSTGVKKNELKPWQIKRWVIPPKADHHFVYHMEDVLDLYHQPYDPANPLVCFDETSKQLTADVKEPVPAVPGRAARYDYEYKRKGVRNLFIFFEPLRGWRHLKVTQRRATVDWAICMKQRSGSGNLNRGISGIAA